MSTCPWLPINARSSSVSSTFCVHSAASCPLLSSSKHLPLRYPPQNYLRLRPGGHCRRRADFLPALWAFPGLLTKAMAPLSQGAGLLLLPEALFPPPPQLEGEATCWGLMVSQRLRANEEKPSAGTRLLSWPWKDPSRLKGACPRAESAGRGGELQARHLAWSFVWNLREHSLVVRTAMDTPWVRGRPHTAPQ